MLFVMAVLLSRFNPCVMGAETRASLCGGKLRLTGAGCDWKTLMLNSDGGSGVVSCLSAVESCCTLIWEIYCNIYFCIDRTKGSKIKDFQQGPYPTDPKTSRPISPIQAVESLTQ